MGVRYTIEREHLASDMRVPKPLCICSSLSSVEVLNVRCYGQVQDRGSSRELLNGKNAVNGWEMEGDGWQAAIQGKGDLHTKTA